MADEQNNNQNENEEKEKKELIIPSFDISYSIEITDLKDVTKSRFTPQQLFGFQETKRTMTWNKNILYPCRWVKPSEDDPENGFPSDRQLYESVEDNNSLLPYNCVFEEGATDTNFYAFYFDLAVMCIYLVRVNYNEDENPDEIPIYINVFRRLDRRINIGNASSSFELDIADGCEYYFEQPLSSLTLTYPTSDVAPHFECWILLSSSNSGCNITYPEGTTFANGDKPDIGEGECWEISIKDKIVIAIMNEPES